MRATFLALAVAFALFALACGGGERERQPAEPAQPAVAGDGVLIAVSEEEHTLTVIHVPTGRTAAELEVGEQPWAVYRPSTNELLVSDVAPSSGRARLAVYGLERSGPAKWRLPMPERAASPVWTQAMALSADERYLYYAVHTRGDSGEPVSGYPRHIAIVDLEARTEFRRAQLPPGCGYYKTLESAGASSVRVFCPPNGSVVVYPGVGEMSVRLFDVPVEFGSVACWSPGSMVSCRMEDGRRIVGERENGEGDVTGLLVYEDVVDEWADRLRLPEGIIHFAPVGADTAALLEEETGVVHLLDLSTGEVSGQLQGPPGADWLIGS